MSHSIKYRDSGKSNIRFYLYKDKEYKLNELAKLPECIVSKATLSGRIVNALSPNKMHITKWKSLKQCLTTPVVLGHHTGQPPGIKKEPIEEIDIIKNRVVYDSFLQFMFIMPIGSLWKQARIMGSMPI